jgi:hypothetical protein
MIKLSQLAPKTLIKEAEEKELPEEFKCFERGVEFLKARIAELNKKAAKYKVPPLEIVIVKEEMVKVIHPDLKKMQMSQSIIIPLDKGLLEDPNSWVLAKQYTLSIKGEPPHVEGYEFIARLEHTPEGNFIYTSPHSSVPNLPSEFKTVNQHCDVCHTNRDRNDTFVIKMEKEDPTRFPDKKAGDLLVVGRNCLARFLPGISVTGLIAYTNMIEATQYDVQEASNMEEFDGMGGGGGGKYYETHDHLLTWIVATYLYTGRYMSKSQANKNAEAGMGGPLVEPTISRALGEMHPNLKYSKNPQKDYPIYFKLKDDPDFQKKVEDMMAEFEAWFPTKDWEKMAAEKPDKADFIHNMALVGKQDYLKSQYFGFFSALFQFFLRDKKSAEDAAAEKKKLAELPPSPVDFSDATLVGKRLRDIAKEAEIKKLIAGGLDEKAVKKAIKGREWGWEVVVKKITEYEKTQTFGYGDAGVGYRILFSDAFGNDFMWFASSTLGMQENLKYIIDGTLTGYEPPNKYHPNKPQGRINRVKVIKDLQHPEAPMPPVVAME